MFVIGQGVLGKIRFCDGCLPEYDRTYLIVSVQSSSISIVNVSSIAGKESKLLFETNRPLKKYKPPFMKESFVKLDSLTTIDNQLMKDLKVLHSGQCLDNVELQEILRCLRIT